MRRRVGAQHVQRALREGGLVDEDDVDLADEGGQPAGNAACSSRVIVGAAVAEVLLERRRRFGLV